jgi:hypothetical protein
MGRPAKDNQQLKRTFSRTAEIIHDLFKLMPAKARKNIAYKDTYDEYIDVEHAHFYHSVDSAGNPQDTSVPIAGHFHVLEVVTPATDDTPAVLKCSPPMKWVKKRNRTNGRFERVAIPVGEHDTHTHTVAYLKSEKYTPRVVNPAAQQFIHSQPLITPPSSLDGVIS